MSGQWPFVPRLPAAPASLVYLITIATSIIFVNAARAQVDAHTLLLLQFDGTFNGAQGETPTAATGVSFTAGVVGQAASFAPGGYLEYPSNGNINAQFGTLEFFIKPTWSGGDLATHNILTYGGATNQPGGIVFSKDGASNLREYFNRFIAEVGASVDVSDWQANQIHYVAYTWDNTAKLLDIYVDGQLKDSQAFASSLPAVSVATFRIGGDDLGAGSGDLRASLDELRISDVARTAAEIQARYAALVPEPSSLVLAAFGLPLLWLICPLANCPIR